MVPCNRRTILTATGVAVTSLAGCLSRDTDDTGDVAESDLPQSVQRVLDPIPADVDGTAIRYLYVIDPSTQNPGSTGSLLGSRENLGVEASKIDRAAIAIYGQSVGQTVAAYTGSFDASEIENPPSRSVSAEDGLAITASSRRTGWDAALDAAEAATDDPETGIDGQYSLRTLFEPLTDMGTMVGLLTVDEESVPEDAEIDTAAVEAIAIGTTMDVEAREETVRYVALFAEGNSADAAVIEEIVRTDSDEVSPEDVDVTAANGRATTTFTRELPHSQLPDNAPAARFGVEYDPETEVATLTHQGGDAVEAANLELRVDGQQVDAPWQPEETIEVGDSFDVQAPPVTLVRVLWVDPNLEDVRQPLGGQFVGAEQIFEASYDPGAEAITVTYTGGRSLDAADFVVHRWDGGGETRLDEFVDALEPDESFVVSEVAFGEGIEIEFRPTGDDALPPESVFWYTAEAPGEFELVAGDGTRTLVYRGETTVSAADYRVEVNDESAQRQWTAVSETLSGGERLDVDAASGDTIVVEYVAGSEPRTVYEHTILPDASFAFAVAESTVEITHDGGDAVAADALSVQIYPSETDRRRDAFASEYETVEEGDSITIEYEIPDDRDASEPEAVVVFYEGQMLDYVEPGQTAGDTEQGTNGGNASQGAE